MQADQVKERPMLFSTPMVRAILDGSKTQTRRVVKGITDRMAVDASDKGGFVVSYDGEPCCGTGVWEVPYYEFPIACPHGQPGERLWGRETFAEEYDYCDHPEMPGAPTEHFHFAWHYRADGEPNRKELEGLLSGWKPSIHMPRAASRILLEISDVRVERLQSISEADCVAEGIHQWMAGMALDKKVSAADVNALCKRYGHGPQAVYAALWDQINGPGAWDVNPYVWAISFRRLKP